MIKGLILSHFVSLNDLLWSSRSNEKRRDARETVAIHMTDSNHYNHNGRSNNSVSHICSRALETSYTYGGPSHADRGPLSKTWPTPVASWATELLELH